MSYTIVNNSKKTLMSFKVDGGLIVGAQETRCDYLIMFSHCRKAFFIELKNREWEKAVRQLKNTVSLLCNEMKEYTPHLRAVVRRGVPNTNYIPLMKLRKDIVSRYPGATLEVKAKFNDVV